MVTFKYIAVDRHGKEVRGQLDALDRRAVASNLRNQSLYLLEAESSNGGGRSVIETLAENSDADFVAAYSPKRWLPALTNDKVQFLRQLALMMRTGMTLTESLEICSQQTLKPKFSQAIRSCSEMVQQGTSFSQAISHQKRFLPNLVVRLVESAEASGELETVLQRSAIFMERRAELRAKLFSSMLYPMVVVITAIAVAVFLVVKVIPKFTDFVTRRGGHLPTSTQLLVDLSGWMGNYGLYLLVFIVVLGMGFLAMFFSKQGRFLIDRAILRVPVVGNLITVAAMAQFNQTMAMLLNSGITLLETLKITANITGNRAISKKINSASVGILRGSNLADSMRDRVIPPLVSQVIRVGERTGALSEVLDDLSEFYDELLQARIKIMSSMIEPVMILLVGGMVGFVYFAFFQAILSLATGGA